MILKEVRRFNQSIQRRYLLRNRMKSNKIELRCGMV